MKGLVKSLCCLCFALSHLGNAYAEPALITYSGRLVDGTGWGQSVLLDLEFRIYDAEVGSEALWSKAVPGVAVEDGFFTVMLGDGFGPEGQALGIADVFASTQQTWLGVTVQETELARQSIGSVPYALRAQDCGSAQLLGGGPSFWHREVNSFEVFLMAASMHAAASCSSARAALVLEEGQTGDQRCAETTTPTKCVKVGYVAVTLAVADGMAQTYLSGSSCSTPLSAPGGPGLGGAMAIHFVCCELGN